MFKYVISGFRFKQKHFEHIFGFVNTNIAWKKSLSLPPKDTQDSIVQNLNTSIDLLQIMLSSDMLASPIIGPSNFFYFSGYGSGL